MRTLQRILLILALPGLSMISSCQKDEIVHHNQHNCQNGIVKDYTGLDGCGLMIELDDGTVLEPVEIPDGYTLAEGQRVCITYEEAEDLGSYCMAGVIARITSIEVMEPLGITADPFPGSNFPDDQASLQEAKIQGDKLILELAYAGGCKPHQFFAVRHLPWCLTPPVPVIIRIYHDANADMCEAWIKKKLEIDLKYLQGLGYNPVSFDLVVNEGDSLITRIFEYHY